MKNTCDWTCILGSKNKILTIIASNDKSCYCVKKLIFSFKITRYNSIYKNFYRKSYITQEKYVEFLLCYHLLCLYHQKWDFLSHSSMLILTQLFQALIIHWEDHPSTKNQNIFVLPFFQNIRFKSIKMIFTPLHASNIYNKHIIFIGHIIWYLLRCEPNL